MYPGRGPCGSRAVKDRVDMLRGIRTRLLGLVIATVVPFTALIGGGLWNQWRGDQSQAFRSALIEARLLAARVDDQITELDSLLIGLSQAVSAAPDDIQANDAALRRAKAELPDYIGNILLSTPDGRNIGTSFEPAASGRTYIGDRDYFRQLLAAAARRRHRQPGARPHHRKLGDIGRTHAQNSGRTAGSRARRRHPDRAFSRSPQGS